MQLSCAYVIHRGEGRLCERSQRTYENSKIYSPIARPSFNPPILLIYAYLFKGPVRQWLISHAAAPALQLHLPSGQSPPCHQRKCLCADRRVGPCPPWCSSPCRTTPQQMLRLCRLEPLVHEPLGLPLHGTTCSGSWRWIHRWIRPRWEEMQLGSGTWNLWIHLDFCQKSIRPDACELMCLWFTVSFDHSSFSQIISPGSLQQSENTSSPGTNLLPTLA